MYEPIIHSDRSYFKSKKSKLGFILFRVLKEKVKDNIAANKTR